ncbi:YecA family protein [Streptococcus oricebi]|uniref:Zinc chelation protein SecC n=1 Tax=Streptococcus oricebi TaxID=1547447 RepID=A0ABS5B1C9_9STRE|nr:SEC-C metal-binding domain-containing protein [Streptococcus oricebi]MBP2622637.1 hypothetical protein [Streptococcus oricebi]
MTKNDFIVCKTCGEVINLRIQMGYYDIPFNISCPECQTQISGFVELNPYRVELVNADSYKGDNPEFPYWCSELSSELNTRKFYKRKALLDSMSPFISQIQLFSSEEQSLKYLKISENVRYFSDYVKNGELTNLIRLFNLFWNQKQKYLYPEIEKEIRLKELPTPLVLSQVNNKIDSIMILHQLLLTTTGIGSVLGQSILEQYSELGRKILEPRYKESVLSYIKYIDNEIDDIEKKAFILLDDLSKIYPQLIPVVVLVNLNKYDSVNQDLYGITTANYQELKKFYVESYEWILRNINIIIALNNIFVRGDFQKCLQDRNYQNNLEKVRNKYNEFSNYLDDKEPFSTPTGNLNNNIRNAIQHYNDHIDYVTQVITFEDARGNRMNKVRISLMDFAKLCLENFSLVFYILEILYNFRKLQLLEVGIIPTLFQDEEKEKYSSPQYFKTPRKSLKIPRNSTCPCGSGKKYKKCCGAKTRR